MPAQVCPSRRIATAGVVLRRAETAHDVNMLDVHAAALELGDRELELVDQERIDKEVLRR
jgi:hypothetical protein